ncbi:MAG: 30S ribosomal protein S8 [Deltaproteobacteria bacterium]|nr:30S ribosomal protein S8 [Deltaproteobacteria bacterium]
MSNVVNDPISDLLTRIRNGALARKDYVDVPYSRMKESIARILSDNGYVGAIEKIPGEGVRPLLRIGIKYTRGRFGVIQGIERISRPGRRVYFGMKDIPSVKSGLGMAIVSTSRGVMSDVEARRQSVGGELLCRVW